MQSLLTGAMQHKTLLYESQSTESGTRLPEVNLNYTISHGSDFGKLMSSRCCFLPRYCND